jgi:flagellar basal-body rod protein FlgB
VDATHGRGRQQHLTGTVGLFDLTQTALERALQGSAARQQALANNIANANTPGYERMDVDFHSAIADALDAAQATASTPDGLDALDALAAPAELPATPIAGQDASGSLAALDFTPQATADPAVSADGNTVSVDQETADMSQNALEYQALVAVEKARLQMIQLAIGSR